MRLGLETWTGRQRAFFTDASRVLCTVAPMTWARARPSTWARKRPGRGLCHLHLPALALNTCPGSFALGSVASFSTQPHANKLQARIHGSNASTHVRRVCPCCMSRSNPPYGLQHPQHPNPPQPSCPGGEPDAITACQRPGSTWGSWWGPRPEPERVRGTAFGDMSQHQASQAPKVRSTFEKEHAGSSLNSRHLGRWIP